MTRRFWPMPKHCMLPTALDEAISAALDVSPNSPAAYVLLDKLYRAQDRREDALAALRTAFELAPYRPDLCYRLGRRLENFDKLEAIEQYETCLEEFASTRAPAVRDAEKRLSELSKPPNAPADSSDAIQP